MLESAVLAILHLDTRTGTNKTVAEARLHFLQKVSTRHALEIRIRRPKRLYDVTEKSTWSCGMIFVVRQR